jgi:hypothetical protein
MGPDVLIGAGNTELFVRDILGLDAESPPALVKQWKQKWIVLVRLKNALIGIRP